jgi:hypothetical protein
MACILRYVKSEKMNRPYLHHGDERLRVVSASGLIIAAGLAPERCATVLHLMDQFMICASVNVCIYNGA